MSANGIVDLRSDTVTRPGAGMRRAMAEAEVGDDVFGEDPTVNALEAEVAERFGKEAALFVASGTMANQVALKAHTQPGDEVVAHPQAHLVRAESAAGGALSGVQFRPVGEPDGTLDPAAVEAVIQSGADPHFAPTRLICLENTHNFAGGKALPLAGLEAVAEVGRRHGVALHLDGARVLNACVALDLRPERIAAPFDSVTLCFSKGLGAPVGSVVMGRREFIDRCRRFRKMFGGGMRQAGVLAAAARYALAHHVERLAEDHARARRLAEGLGGEAHLELPYGLPETNLVFFRSTHPDMPVARLARGLRERGVLVTPMPNGMGRAATHLDVGAEGVERALAAVREVMPA